MAFARLLNSNESTYNTKPRFYAGFGIKHTTQKCPGNITWGYFNISIP